MHNFTHSPYIYPRFHSLDHIDPKPRSISWSPHVYPKGGSFLFLKIFGKRKCAISQTMRVLVGHYLLPVWVLYLTRGVPQTTWFDKRTKTMKTAIIFPCFLNLGWAVPLSCFFFLWKGPWTWHASHNWTIVPTSQWQFPPNKRRCGGWGK